jgi:hypothetical protein
MKLVFALAAALALAPAAFAQDACEPYRKIIEAAPDGFKTFRGQQTAPNIFISTTRFPGYAVCQIVAFTDVMFACRRYMGSETRGRSEYDKTAAQIRVCFPGWTEKPLIETHNERLDNLEGFRLVRQDAAGEIVVGAGLTRDTSGREPVHRLVISFMLLPPDAVS